MRIRNLIKGDIAFQFKYGFYFIYTVFTILYVCLLYAFPPAWRSKAGIIMIYTDPAAMGLFFMGAIVLLEKSQRVLDSIAVSPVKVSEYIISKVTSIGIISTVVGVIIALFAGTNNIATVIIGTFFGSVMFSLFGLIVAAKVTSLNQFLIATVPFEIICILPALVYLFGYQKALMLLHPGCIIVRFISGNCEYLFGLILILCVWIAMIYFITYRIIRNMFQSVGGVKL